MITVNLVLYFRRKPGLLEIFFQSACIKINLNFIRYNFQDFKNFQYRLTDRTKINKHMVIFKKAFVEFVVRVEL